MALTAPTIVTPYYGGEVWKTPIVFSWGAATGSVDFYEVEVQYPIGFVKESPNTAFSTPRSITTVTGFYTYPVGATLKWRVRAWELYTGLAGPWSSYATFTIQDSAEIPAQISPLGAAYPGTVVNTTNPTFSWGAGLNASTPAFYGLYIEHYKNPTTTEKFLNTEDYAGDHSSLSFVPSGVFLLVNGEKYRWKVRSKTYRGSYTDYSAWQYISVDTTPPPAPVPTGPAPISYTEAGCPTIALLNPTFSWAPVAGATVYTINIEYRDGAAWKTVPTSKADITGTSYPLPGGSALVTDTQYRWQVRAAYVSGYYGAYSSWAFFYVHVPLTPTAPVLSEPGSTGIPAPTVTQVDPTLKWVASTGPGPILDYRVTIQAWNGSAYVDLLGMPIAVGSDTTFLQVTAGVGLADGGIYRWTCAAQNADGWGANNAGYLYFYVTLPVIPVSVNPPVLMSPGRASSPVPDETDTTPTFEWVEASGATGYALYIDHLVAGVYTSDYNSEGGGPIVGTPTATPGMLSFAYPGPALVNGTTYRWRMSSYDGSTYGAKNINPFYFKINVSGGYPPANFQPDPEIPAAGPMHYYMGRIWYAFGRIYTAADIVGGAAGTKPYGFRDAVIKVTENPLAVTPGDGFKVPSMGGNIYALNHPASIDAALGEGRLTIICINSVYQLSVPVTRSDWSAVGTGTEPLQTVVQESKGTPAERSVVSHNGDLFYYGSDNTIRSLSTAVKYFGTWGNVSISSNAGKALSFNQDAFSQFVSSCVFDNRLLTTCYPVQMEQGVAFKAVIPLDFDIISSLQEKLPPAWEGHWEGLNILQVLSKNFHAKDRAFAVVAAEDGGIDVWEISKDDKADDADKADPAGDKRIGWYSESPAYDWSSSGNGQKLKQLDGGEVWLDQVTGTVELTFYYRPDSDPCWHLWHRETVCAARDTTENPATPDAYPTTGYEAGYKWPVMLPTPPMVKCQNMNARPSHQGYQFQLKVVGKGYARVRAVLLHATVIEQAPFYGLKG